MSTNDITQEHMDLLEHEAVDLAQRYRDALYAQINSLTLEAKRVGNVCDDMAESAGYLRAIVDTESPEVDLDAAREGFARDVVRLTERVIRNYLASKALTDTAQQVRDKARKVR